jgi:hypothetical protein
LQKINGGTFASLKEQIANQKETQECASLARLINIPTNQNLTNQTFAEIFFSNSINPSAHSAFSY